MTHPDAGEPLAHACYTAGMEQQPQQSPVKTGRLLYWTPRILAILMAAFISIFALDVFEEGKSIGEIALALLIHLVPTMILVIALVVAWKRERVGGWLFLFLGVAMAAVSRLEWAALVMISLPLVVTGALFLLQAQRKV